MNRKISLSTCIITKNEEFYIENCLRSIKNISDEIIIVDTGSTDKTVEICQKYTNKIFFTKWEDDFAKARNESISKAKSDWILYLDADEILDYYSSKKIKNYLQSLDDKPYVIVGKIVLPNKTFFMRSVLFKNNHNIKFEEKIHEQLKADNELTIYYPFIKIYVTRFDNPDKLEKKAKKYFDLLKESLNNEKDKLKLIYKYRCLANISSNIKEKLDYFSKSIELIDDDLERYSKEFYEALLIEYIDFLIKIKDYNKALNFSKILIEKFPENYIAGYYIACCLIRLNKIEDAFDILQSELNHIYHLKNYLIEKEHLKALINIELGRIELIKGDEDNYYSHLLIAKNLYDFEEINFYLFAYFLVKEDLKNAVRYIHSISSSEDINKLIIVSENFKNERIYYEYILKLLNEVKKANHLLIDKESWLIENKIIYLEHKIKEINNKLLQVKNNLPNIKVLVKVLNSSLISNENIIKLKYISDDITLVSRNKIESSNYSIVEIDYKNDFDLVNKFYAKQKNDYFMILNSYEQLSENTIINLPNILKDNKEDILYSKIQNINIDEAKNFYTFREVLFKNKIYSDFNLFSKDKSYRKILIYNLGFFFEDFQKEILNETLFLENTFYKKDIANLINYKNISDNYNYFINDYNKAMFYYNKAIEYYLKENLENTSNFYIELLLGFIRSNILVETNDNNLFKILNETIDLVPNIPDVIFYLSKYNDVLGNNKKAIEILKYLENLFESKSNINILKVASFEQSIRILVFLELSKLYKKEKNEIISENYLEKALEQSPNSMYVNLCLSKFYLFDNNLEKSLNYLINSRFINISEKEKIVLKTYLNEEINSENYNELYKFILSSLLKYPYWNKYEKLELKDKEFFILYN